MNKLPDFFMERLYKEYNEEQANQIIEGYKLERKLTFRVNTIKTTAEKIEQRLVENGIMYKKVKWSKEAFIILNRNEEEIQKIKDEINRLEQKNEKTINKKEKINANPYKIKIIGSPEIGRLPFIVK